MGFLDKLLGRDKKPSDGAGEQASSSSVSTAGEKPEATEDRPGAEGTGEAPSPEAPSSRQGEPGQAGGEATSGGA
jgi:hypothetical protein